jgi:aldose sugar dehydrogenase
MNKILFSRIGCFVLTISLVFYLTLESLIVIVESQITPPPATPQGKIPGTIDPNLKVDLVFRGIRYPSNMAFLGPDDILVLEKDNGTVRRIVNGTMLSKPLLEVNVRAEDERGMLGIAVSTNNNSTQKYVFLYYTEEGDRGSEENSDQDIMSLRNRLYRYELIGDELQNGKLLLDLPATPRTHHNGGNVIIGPDHNIYVSIGDIETHRTQAQNIHNASLPPDGTSGILRVTQDGRPVVDNFTLGDAGLLEYYYAYGIRNSFGMDFDPVTGKMWDTENGPGFGDEINLVEPGFNSGWIKIQGIWRPQSYFRGETVKMPFSKNILVDFDEKGKYSPPEFTFNQTTGLTALKFLDSDKMGKKYENDMFVADINNGFIYDFDLNQNRTQIAPSTHNDTNTQFTDKIANNIEESKDAVFASGFPGITDLEVGPDGYLYVLSFHKSLGRIHKIVPS